jgi:hypothetical protein
MNRKTSVGCLGAQSFCGLVRARDPLCWQVGQRAMLRYTEFTSNECLPDSRGEHQGDIGRDDIEHSVLAAVDGEPFA